MRVLVDQKRVPTALEHIKKLSEGLTNPNERQSAYAESLFYSWLLEGRTSSALVELESILGLDVTSGETDTWLQNLGLRTQAMKLQLCLLDSRQKPELVNQYKAHINNLFETGLEDEAFFCLLELLDFVVARPFPNIPEALALIDDYKELPEIGNRPYRSARLRIFTARLGTELSLQSAQYPISHRVFEDALLALKKAGAKRDVGQNLASYGGLLLKYGDANGRKLINKSIRHFQELKNDQSLVAPAASLISWLKVTGNQQAINSYLDLISSPIKGKARPVLDAGVLSKTKDAAVTANQCFSLANIELQNVKPERARKLLLDLGHSINALGHTALSVKVMAQLNLCSLKLGNGFSETIMTQVIRDWVELGYVYKALEYICQRVRLGVEDSRYAVKSVVLNGYLEKASSILQGKTDMLLAEALGDLYEISALAFLFENDTIKTLCLLRDANQVYTEYGLRPKLAFNYLYQAKVTQFQLLFEDRSSHLDIGKKSLDEASSLFRSMGHRAGVKEAQLLLNQLRNNSNSLRRLDSVIPGTDLVKTGIKKHDLLVESGLAATPVYRIFSAFVSKHEQSVLRTLITQPFNHN